MTRSFLAFECKEDSHDIGSLHVENEEHTITLSGEIVITKDKVGLARALEIKRVVDSTVSVLRGVKIPDDITLQQ